MPHPSLLYGLAAVAMWSTVAVAFKLALAGLPPLWLLAVATVTSALVLCGVLGVQGRLAQLRHAPATHWRRAALMGAINPLAYYAVLFAAYDRLLAQVAQPVNYTWAITLALLSVPLLGHRLTRGDMLGGLLAYGGVVVIVTQGGSAAMHAMHYDTWGIALALGSTLLWAGYWILCARKDTDEREPLLALTQNFVVAAPAALALAAMLAPWPDARALTLPVMGAALWTGIFEMGLAFACWLAAMRTAPSTARLATLIFLSPFVSLMLIGAVLGETVHGSTWLGLVCIVAGLAVQQRYAASR